MGVGGNRKVLKAALSATLPVFAGFTFVGIAYGMLMDSKGYGLGWTVMMSAMAFAGSAQYLAITFLTSAFNPLYALLMTLMVNARHLFYGVSLLEKYRDVGRMKPYLIFALCDETFSVILSNEPPEGVNRNLFYLLVTLLGHVYWVLGSALGALLGPMIPFSTRGLDFVLTALFVVIFVGQWKAQRDHGPAAVGVLCSAACLAIFGPRNFIIPSMVAILAALMAMRSRHALATEGAGGGAH